eukprot:CAMPEP_0170617032 /NCGR_PEP_ID=MMETSP0224-20130122/26190_1 /TAXON_ID=285029 /ORGANISM="Togula jolla, Strain CCCM 725" /LENGTH=475 /DNA_ID=CAMNT_0010942875 /DNA_START=50 /DNA_END=1474 /DNA_ORIENTATION=-
MEAKAKLRTSEDVYKRLKQQVQWDEEWIDGEEVWLGYEDGIFGPMEQRLMAFVPIGAGGDLPFTRVWYFRRGDEILWDRRRRLDVLWGSGETPTILAAQEGRRLKGYNPAHDREAEAQTLAAVRQAQDTRVRLEEERRIAAEEKHRKKLRHANATEGLDREAKAAHNWSRGQRGADSLNDESPVRECLTVVTWNCLNDAFPLPPELDSGSRAPRLVSALRDNEPDVVALQEVTSELLAALDVNCPYQSWRTDEPGELAIWSRLPIARAISVSLGPNTCKRALLVEVHVHRRSVVIVNVHFTSDRRGHGMVDNSQKRESQARILRAALARHMPHAVAFVCGDFNEPGVSGQEAAVGCMAGLEDAWLAVHGDRSPGFTFDPTTNWLAELNSVSKTPKRLDRIFAPPQWRPMTAYVIGDAGDISDHYGLGVTFRPESTPLQGIRPVHRSAAVLLVPAEASRRIDAIRQQIDPAYVRWR